MKPQILNCMCCLLSYLTQYEVWGYHSIQR